MSVKLPFYIHILIDEEKKTFHVEHTSIKPDSAYDTLKNIEKIVKEGLDYDTNYKDNYSHLSKEDLLNKLKEKATEVKSRYETKFSKINFIYRVAFLDEKGKQKNQDVLNRINNYVIEKLKFDSFPVPDEIMFKIGEHLNSEDLKKVSLVSKRTFIQTEDSLIRRAAKLGFEGETVARAKSYLKAINIEFKRFYKDKPVDDKSIFDELSKLSTEELITFFDNEDFKKGKYPYFVKFITQVARVKEKSEEVTNVPALNRALKEAVLYGNIGIAKALLLLGAQPTIRKAERFDEFSLTSIMEYATLHDPKFLDLFLNHDIAYPVGLDAQDLMSAAITTRNLKLIDKLIEKGATISPEHLIMAAETDKNIDILKIFLEKGVNPNLVNSDKTTALHKAASSGATKAVDLLLQYNADINALDRLAQTPLFLACKKNDAKIAETLLLNGADPLLNNSQQQSPVQISFNFFGDTAVLDLLIKFKADLNNVDINGNTTLSQADVKSAEKLLKAGVKPDQGELLLAIQNVEWEKAELFLKYEADPNETDAQGNTLLHLALKKRAMGFAQTLITEYKVNAEQKDPQGYTPLMLALGMNDNSLIYSEDLIKLLMKDKNDLHQVAPNGITIFDWLNKIDDNGNNLLTRSYNRYLLLFLIDCGIDVNHKNNDGNTPLHIESLSWGTAVEIFLKNKADPNIKNNDGNTPLHLAVTRRAEIIPLLIKNHADIHLKNNKGYTPLMLALGVGKKKYEYETDYRYIKHLISSKDDLNAMTPIGMSILDWLRYKENKPTLTIDDVMLMADYKTI